MTVPQLSNVAENTSDIVKQFQIGELSVEEKSKPEYGKQLSKKIWGYVISGMGGYYFNRNARFRKNRNYSNGRIDIRQMFQDRFEMNGKQNYIRLNWNALQLVNRIVSGLVGRWMKRGEKIQVSATDSLSVDEKQTEYDNLEFIIENRAQLEELQAKSGIKMIPDGEIPADKDELNLWQSQFQRLPEEILYELGCNDVLQSNGWFDVLKEMMLRDAAETLLVGTYTYMDEQGVIHVERLKPENIIYSFSEYADFRDTTWRGHAPSLKISEIRRRYGKQFNPDNPLALDEKQLWAIAQTAKEIQYYSNIQWTNTWFTDYIRPYDEWNVRSINFEFKTVDEDIYTVTTSKSTGSTYTQKGYPKTASGKKRDKPSSNQRIVSDSNWNIYKGVYLPDNDILLEWGLKDNMIRPQDPKEIGNAEFSYSFYMPQNYEMRNLAIPEKIEAAIDGMILACLKIQQDVSMSIPPGWVIDETAWSGVDFGLGEAGNKAIDRAKLFFQTGKIYYKGLDAEGNRVPVPVQEITNTGFQQHIEAFVRTYQFWYQSLKDELGEDPNLLSAALQPRVTTGNVEASQLQSEYATDYIYNAYSECMKITARKVNCLLKDSVTYGSAAYRKLIGKEDIDKREFSTDIKFIPTDQEVQMFIAIMNEAIRSTPELVLFIDPFRLTRIAKEDIKLAELLFRQGQKKMLIHQQEVAAQNQEATFKAQIESAKAGEQEKQNTEKIKGEVLAQSKTIEAEATNKNAVISMVTSLLSKGEPVPPNLMPLVNVVIENMIIPLASQNEEQKAAIMQGLQQQQEPQEQMLQQQAEVPLNNEQAA